MNIISLPVVVCWLYFFTVLLLNSSASYSQTVYPSIIITENELKVITNEMVSITPPRNSSNVESLNEAAQKIFNRLKKYGYNPEYQEYDVHGVVYKNVIARIGPKGTQRIIVGAHYDVYGESPGADDNASGIAGLITLARLLKLNESRLKKTIEIVAYTLEEPPYFRSESMGSFIHAKSLHDKNIDVLGMIAIEMIGYFSSAPNSQLYPVKAMEHIYPSTADFIAVVSNVSSSPLSARVKKYFGKSAINVQRLVSPEALRGVDFSDHLNYWHFDYSAIMVSDTAFYRNSNYHTPADNLGTLDFSKMKEVVRGLFYAILNLGS